MARALGAGPMIDAVALAATPAEEKKPEDESDKEDGSASGAGTGRFGNTGKWVPSLSGAR